MEKVKKLTYRQTSVIPSANKVAPSIFLWSIRCAWRKTLLVGNISREI